MWIFPETVHGADFIIILLSRNTSQSKYKGYTNLPWTESLFSAKRWSRTAIRTTYNNWLSPSAIDTKTCNTKSIVLQRILWRTSTILLYTINIGKSSICGLYALYYYVYCTVVCCIVPKMFIFCYYRAHNAMLNNTILYNNVMCFLY